MKQSGPLKKHFNCKIISIKQIIPFVFVFLILQFFSKVSAQDNVIISNATQAEKIYLQLDRNIYTTGDIIYFKSIVLNAYNNQPSSLSKILYVELVTPEESVFEKKLIKTENGIGQGFFFLDKSLHEGTYLVRAYTQWDRNFGSDFFFEEYIHVFATKEEDETKKPIRGITLIKEADKNRLKASFNPFLIDDQHKNKLTVYITIDNIKDSISIKRGKDDLYQMDYEIENESQFATLQIQTDNGQKYTKTIVLYDNFFDLQFFPESGELVNGLESKVGFKALDANGKGKFIAGDIVDEKDSVVTDFKSNKLGMGSFILSKADSTKKYYARLMSQSDEDEIDLYPLPDVASTGNILSVEKQGDKILLTAKSNYFENDSIYLDVSFRGTMLYEKKTGLTNGVFRMLVSTVELSEGIIAFTMLNKFKRPVAERLYFNEKLKSRLNIAVKTDKDRYAKREKTELEIKTTNSDGEPVNANASVLVINKRQLGSIQNTRQNILSWFLLNSELKGKIEDPGFYFSGDSSHFNELDALMLTQGWVKYNYSKHYDAITYMPEKNLSVSGEVSSLLSEKKKKQPELTMITFGEFKNAYTTVTDSAGTFRFDLNDEYGGEVNVLIQSSKKKGEKANYNVKLDEKESPPVEFNQIKTVENLDSLVHVLVEKSEERKNIDEAFPLDSGNFHLDEVEVTGYKLTPTRKKVIERYGEPTEIIDGKAIEEKIEKWSSGIYSVLLFNFSDRIIIKSTLSGVLYASIIGADATLIMVDGIPVKYADYGFIPFIPPSEVSSFEVIRCAKNFTRLYLEVSDSGTPPTGVDCGGIIAIYTYSGKGIYARNTIGMTKNTIPVFSAPREFYAPKYNNLKPDDWTKPDLRTLVHWEPELITDSEGKTSLSFYNADNTGDMVVVVEAVSDDGEIGYVEYEYIVEGR